ncbi:MAG: SDR family oxidoreductase [Bacteroidota bacterium]
MHNLFDIKDKVILITGATGVLGSSIATYLAQNGAQVGLLARKANAAKKLQERIEFLDGKAFTLVADVTDESQLQSVQKNIEERFQGMDGLINAAGGNIPGATIAPDKTLLDSDTEALRQIIDLNYIGTYLPIKIFLPLFSNKNKGSIINISSMSAERPLTRVMGYSSSKAAIDNLTKWLAVEFAQKHGEGLRVNAIAPGFFLTTQNKNLLTQEDGSLTSRGNQIISNTPMGRFGAPEELFGAVHYLCSDASKFVTGTTMAIDGGFGCYSGV